MNRDCLGLSDENAVALVAGLPVSTLDEIIHNKSSHYDSFMTPKKSGGEREINPPFPLLMGAQKRIKQYIETRTVWTKAVQGGVRRRSIFTNAKLHLRRTMVVNLDIKSFFPSTKRLVIQETLQRCGCKERAAYYLSELVTFRDSLPQGAPTSTMMGNLSLELLDRDFMKLSHDNSLTYSRYVDDLTVSGNRNLLDFKGAFETIVERYGYEVAPTKFTFTDRSKTQLVTGLVVNDILRPSTQFIRELRDTIKACWPENGGPANVAAAEDETLNGLRMSLRGKSLFVRSVHNKLGRRLLGLMAKINWKAPTPEPTYEVVSA